MFNLWASPPLFLMMQQEPAQEDSPEEDGLYSGTYTTEY
jgi:hypothetical protein